ncbi:MAG TPA: pilus assembly protein TadG-related protein [Burkholderiaceae bacterium]|nr:pilus assembly protein TadG-related protein [Burkholderiaceae bacterium]
MHETGQALVFGLFVMFAGLLSLFFLFNAGQLTAEKVKLVNTADAVAYSAGLLEARSLNFDAYGNRALIANEIAIAQMVSLSSWAQYAGELGTNLPLQFAGPTCYEPMPYYGKSMLLTYGLCYLLYYGGWAYADAADPITTATEAVAVASEALKTAIKTSQTVLHNGALIAARQSMMSRVADANYHGDGSVSIDLVPLEDNFTAMIQKYVKNGKSGDERARLGNLVKDAASRDSFVQNRSWTDTSLIPTCIGINGIFFDRLKRRGGTELLGYDEWKAMDTMSIHRAYIPSHSLECEYGEAPIGSGAQAAVNAAQSGGSYGGSMSDNPGASSMASSSDWNFYTGIPEFYDLSDSALKKLDPRVRLSIRLTRNKVETRTTETKPDLQLGGNLAVYNADQASNVIAATSSSEVYFERPEPRSDGKKELASLFNPFWHVHLISTGDAAKTQAAALQGAAIIPD